MNVNYLIEEHNNKNNNNTIDSDNISSEINKFINDDYNNEINNEINITNLQYFLTNYNYNDNKDCIMNKLYLYYNQMNVKKISHILNYYKIYKHKLTKNEMIQILIFFETDQFNIDIVNKRIYLWKNIEELKNDSFFNKFILF